jgi:nitrile hydratase
VRVKNEFVSGHVRMRAIFAERDRDRGCRLAPTHFPDAAAHNLQAEDEATVHVAVFESYLKKAP